MDDQILQLAFSICHNPGVYALLLGSGASRSANIPTGQEVTNDLIRRIALGLNQEISGEPYTWYMERYGEEPGYDTLIEKLGITAFERHSLLQQYFEPTDEERQQGIKLPSRAHRSIAKLIKSGHVRVVLTTNFDRLLEKALEDEGVIPDVISTVDALKGARPLQHSPITIIKLHGDYRDGRIKNTAQELAKYDKQIDQLLDRVLDEYGLIICGWSAEWDTALRNAFYRSKRRRYTIYWTVYDKLTDDAQRLCTHCHSENLNIKSADDFFYELEQTVAALQSSNQRHPLSIPVAVERMKKLLPNPQSHIELEELFQDEVERAYQRIVSDQFYSSWEHKIPNGIPEAEAVERYTNLYYQEIELVLNLTATLCWYDDGKYSQLITNAVSRWLEIPQSHREMPVVYLPILLFMYTAGITVSRRENWRYLQAFCFDPQVPKSVLYTTDSDPNFMDFISEIAFLPFIRGFSKGQSARLNVILQNQLRSVFEKLLPSQSQYLNTFDLFEMLLSLAYLRITTGKHHSNWMPIHLTCYFDRSWGFIKTFWQRGGRQREEWGLLHIEPFISHDRPVEETLKLYGEIARRFQKEYRHGMDAIPDFAEVYQQGKSSDVPFRGKAIL